MATLNWGWAAALLLASSALVAPAEAQTRAAAAISVLAGTGLPGTTDGPGLQATFLMPAALAFAPDGTLYVADAAAQRIRAIARDGAVRTLAGSGDLSTSALWIEGGFQDGPVNAARFAHPAGLAVRGDGALYVADTFNHCIRLISGGSVSTAAGQCGVPGFANGRRPQNRLAYPRGLAMCAGDDHLYIADQKNGLRSLDASGTLATIRLPVDFNTAILTSVACAPAGDRQYLYVAVKDRIVRYGLQAHDALVAFNASPPLSMNSVQGGAPLGHAYSLAVLSPDSLIYGDLLDGAVRYVEDFLPGGAVPQPHVQYVGATPAEDAPLGLAGSSTDRFSAPMGVAVDGDGRVAIADAIQRKIYLVRFNENRHAFNTSPQTAGSSGNEFRIVIEGNYLVWYATGFADSVAGLLERRLESDRHGGMRVRVLALHSPCPDVEWSKRNRADLVIFLTTSYVADCDGVPRFRRNLLLTQEPGAWQAALRKTFQPAVDALAQAHIPGLNVLLPFAWEVTPNEELYRTEEIGYAPAMTDRWFAFASDYSSAEANLVQSLSATRLPLLNLFPIFRAYERGAHAQTLYATEDLEPSARGRQATADAIAAFLEKQPPWRR